MKEPTHEPASYDGLRGTLEPDSQETLVFRPIGGVPFEAPTHPPPEPHEFRFLFKKWFVPAGVIPAGRF